MTVSRRALLLGAASTATLAGCSRGPAPVVTPTASPSGAVRDQLQQVMDAYRANTDLLGLSVKDLRTGGEFSWQGDWVTQSASIAKVMIVLLALVQARRAGTELPFEDYGRASRAIIDSENDPADELWEKVGGKQAYTTLARELGLADTHGDDRSEFWSWTNTTADDQRKLAEVLVTGSDAIHVEDQLYLLDLMSKTNPNHTWGVGHPKKRDEVHVSMKNGWVQFQSIDNLWGVNSMGHVRGQGRDYVAAIMTRMPTFDEGRALVDGIGADVFTILEAELA
ncbi:MAG TPA: serine hydrolase [Propionibacterium sp.]|nr:serine hydrolase [Propionibacterium sp.]